MPVGSTSWSFTEGDFASITETLTRFLHESNARCALLVDRSGQLVATVGEQPKFDPTAFATLTAADFSANDPFHVRLEQLANSVWVPGEQSRWFYERARGSYQTITERAFSRSASSRATSSCSGCIKQSLRYSSSLAVRRPRPAPERRGGRRGRL